MIEKRNISILRNCYGCGVCVAACPVNVIALKENADGFYSPEVIDSDGCINCGLCLKVCAFNNQLEPEAQQSAKVKGYGAWSTDEKVRQWCSSGGVGFEVGRALIEQGYEAVGVRYDVSRQRAEHFIAATVEDFMPSVGSKYIPSDSAGAFKAIDRRKKYLVTGTPCQIASMRRLVRHFKVEENFVLLDFFCHGTPSLKMWDIYLRGVEAQTGPVKFVSWRNKSTGWHDSWAVCADQGKTEPSEPVNWHDSYNLKIWGKKHFYASRLSQNDKFYAFFLGNVCLNDCCYGCTLKMANSAADIRIGDFWGRTYEADSKGVSAVLALTPKGREVIEALAAERRIELREHPAETVMEGQMPCSPKRPWIYGSIRSALRKGRELPTGLLRLWQISLLPGRVINKLKRIILKK